MSEDTQINISTTTEIINVDVTETLQPVSLECFFAQGSSSDTNIDVTETVQNIELNVTEVEAQNVEIDYFYPAGPPGQSVWGTISGTLSTQTDLWKYLSAAGASNFDITTLNSYLSTNSILLCSLNVNGVMLSAGVNLSDIFLTSETESQTLSYNVTGENLSISSGNTLSLSALSYRNFNISLSTVETIQQFAENFASDIHPGYTVKLYNGRIYAFAGTDKNNPGHYLEVNANPYLPIYREIALSGDQTEVIDSFFLGDFKTAKYNLQIETNFNNEIYYSEINVVGSIQTSTGVASEYGQIYTDQLILGYDVSVLYNNLNFTILYNADMTPGRKLVIKGHRTNFYKI